MDKRKAPLIVPRDSEFNAGAHEHHEDEGNMETYLANDAYERIIDAIMAICPLLEREQIVDYLASRNIWPESSRPDDAPAGVIRLRPATISA